MWAEVAAGLLILFVLVWLALDVLGIAGNVPKSYDRNDRKPRH